MKHIKKEESMSESSEDNILEEMNDPSDITQYDLCMRWVSKEEFSQETLSKIQQTLTEALINRVESIHIITDLSFFPSLNAASNDIVLLFKYDKSQCYKQLIMGPPSNQSDAVEKFQYYWGEKSELRRFRDGSLKYVVAHQTKWDETYSTNEYFIKLLLTKHFNVNEKQLISNVVNITKELPPFNLSLEVIDVIGQLSHHLKSLQLPLQIDSVRAYGPLSRYTSYSIPQKVKDVEKLYQQIYFESIPLMVEFEISEKWPDELRGIKLMECAFNIKIKELLRKHHHIQSHVFEDHLEIYFKGYVFSVNYFVPQELALLRMSSNEGVDEYIYQHKTIPVLSNWISQFPSNYPSFSQSSRLLKKWISSQMLSYYISDDIIDAICIHYYLSNQLYTPQKFFLTFIEEFATNDMYPIQLGDGNDSVESSKGFAFNFEDHEDFSQYFNAISPSTRVVKYLCSLCKNTWKLIENNFCLNTSTRFNQMLFNQHIPKHAIKLDINKGLLTKQNVNYNEEFTRNSISLTKKFVSVVDFDPLKLYCDELNDYFNGEMMLFVDLIHGSDIYLMFNPSGSIGSIIKKNEDHCELNDFMPKDNIQTVGELKFMLKLLGGSIVKDVIIY